jgi:heat shock protein HslJ
MKRCLVLVLLAVAGCATPNKEPPSKPFAGTRWQMVLELPVPGEQPSVRFGDGRLEGFGGCNRFAAAYVQDSVGARAIAIRRIEMNRRLCDPGAQMVESRMLEILQSVSSYSVTGDLMTMSGSGGTLRFRAMTDEANMPAAPLAGTRWVGLVNIALDERNTPWLEFGDGRLTGFTGCNSLTGGWTSDGGQVRFAPLVATKRACAGPEGDIERRFLAAVSEQSRVSREGRKLVLTGPAGERFEFVESARMK